MKIVVLTGAGISAESGINTFRDSGGLWEGHDISEVATPQAWEKNQNLVLDFYNKRRKQAMQSEPNKGHKVLAELQEHHDVTIITQNVDNLHERAGSKDVIHLHGELQKVRSTVDENLIYTLDGWELKAGDLCEKGSQLRPHIVWFGEMVPKMDEAIETTTQADVLMIVGTSMVVYPAAGLINYVSNQIPIYLVDPKIPEISTINQLHVFEESAATGVQRAIDHLKKSITK